MGDLLSSPTKNAFSPPVHGQRKLFKSTFSLPICMPKQMSTLSNRGLFPLPHTVKDNTACRQGAVLISQSSLMHRSSNECLAGGSPNFSLSLMRQ